MANGVKVDSIAQSHTATAIQALSHSIVGNQLRLFRTPAVPPQGTIPSFWEAILDFIQNWA